MDDNGHCRFPFKSQGICIALDFASFAVEFNNSWNQFYQGSNRNAYRVMSKEIINTEVMIRNLSDWKKF